MNVSRDPTAGVWGSDGQVVISHSLQLSYAIKYIRFNTEQLENTGMKAPTQRHPVAETGTCQRSSTTGEDRPYRALKKSFEDKTSLYMYIYTHTQLIY